MCALLAVTASGAGEPLVMLHGLATDGRIWSMVVPRLARRRRVITVDVPGFGASAAVDEDFRLEAVAQRIARGLAAQGVSGPYDLVGHSLGGGIALTLADLHPRLVRRLVLVAPAGLQPLPAAGELPTMPHPCAGVPANAWCPAPTAARRAKRTEALRKR